MISNIILYLINMTTKRHERKEEKELREGVERETERESKREQERERKRKREREARKCVENSRYTGCDLVINLLALIRWIYKERIEHNDKLQYW